MTSDGITAALIQLQADLPYVTKTAQAQYGKYADLAHVSRIIMPRLAELGLAFTACPTMAADKFVLEYRLEHAPSGEHIGGHYPLGTGNPQQLGSAITYARRYCLLAVTGVAPDEDDDDGQEAAAGYAALRNAPPEVDEHGAATFAEQERMVTGKVPGAWRSSSTAENDPHYDSKPDPEQQRERALRAMFAQYKDLGVTEKDEMLADISGTLGRDVASRADLSVADVTAVNAMLRRRLNASKEK